MLFKNQAAGAMAVSYNAQLQREANLKKFFSYSLMLAVVAVFALMPDLAHAAGGGLTQAKSGLEKFLTEIQPIVRVLAVIAIIATGIAYVMNMVDKSQFFKIIAGIIIIASASEIVNFFWT